MLSPRTDFFFFFIYLFLFSFEGADVQAGDEEPPGWLTPQEPHNPWGLM